MAGRRYRSQRTLSTGLGVHRANLPIFARVDKTSENIAKGDKSDVQKMTTDTMTIFAKASTTIGVPSVANSSMRARGSSTAIITRQKGTKLRLGLSTKENVHNMRGGQTESHQIHNLKIVGSTPTPATKS